MKKILLPLLCILLSCCFAACSVSIENLDREETYPDFPGSLETIYTSMEQLAQDADIIAEVTVAAQEVVSLDGLPQTHSQVRIEKLFKGSAAENDILAVIEEGCLTEVESVTLGVPPMAHDGKYILYLTEYNGNYYILGAFQGKFIVKEGYVFQQSTEEVKMKAYSPITVEDFRKMFS